MSLPSLGPHRVEEILALGLLLEEKLRRQADVVRPEEGVRPPEEAAGVGLA